jgi:ubiquitin
MIDFFAGDRHELTEKLAYANWERRGRPLGSPEVDWTAAEKTLASSFRYSEQELPSYSLQMEPYEGSYQREEVGLRK